MGYVNRVEYKPGNRGQIRLAPQTRQFGKTTATFPITQLDTCYRVEWKTNEVMGSANIPEGHTLLMFQNADCSGSPYDTFSGTGKVKTLPKKYFSAMKLQKA